MLRIMVSPRRSVCSVATMVVLLKRLVAAWPRQRDLRLGIVLAQGMSGPAVWQEQPAQIGMILKLDAEEIKHLAFRPICRAPDAAYTRHRDIGIGVQLETEPLPVTGGQQVVHDVEAWLAVEPVHTRQVNQEVEAQSLLAEPCHVHDRHSVDERRCFPPKM